MGEVNAGPLEEGFHSTHKGVVEENQPNNYQGLPLWRRWRPEEGEGSKWVVGTEVVE